MKKFKSLQSCTLMQLTFLVFILAFTAYSQKSTNSNEQIKESDSFLHIGFLNEAALYYHYSPIKSFTLKTGFAFNWNYNETKSNEGFQISKAQHLSDPEGRRVNLKEGSNYNSYQAIFSSVLYYNLSNNSITSIYIGLGPSISYNYWKNNSFYNTFTDTSFNYTNQNMKSSELGAGLTFSLMVKSRVYDNYYLVGEYNFSTLYTWNNSKQNSEYRDKYSTTSGEYFSSNYSESKGNGWRIQFSNVKIGILIGL